MSVSTLCLLAYAVFSLAWLISSACDSSCHQCLSTSDFSLGTFRIVQSGKYCLSENVVVNPLSGNIESPNSNFDWLPQNPSVYEGCDALKFGAFALGFFTAISIETSNVEIDLNTFEISQHFHFYIQQRFFSIIEIGKSPFLQGFGPTDFGSLESVSNISIHNGKLGLSSHHGIHSNEANNVQIYDLQIYDFEVGGIQLNGFTNVEITNINIGPSATNVVTSGLYSNAKFLSLAFEKLLQAIIANNEDANQKIITFSRQRQLSLQQIYDNLLTSMDIAFRYFIDQTTSDDIMNELFSVSINLYENASKLPDGSTLYGLLFHSRNVAVFGFGNFENDPPIDDGANILIQNVKVHDLQNNINEIPVAHFDKCENEIASTVTPVKGPFGDVMDLRKMIGAHNEKKLIIDDMGHGGNRNALKYIGNPLSDAQIALGLYGKNYNGLDYNTNGMENENSGFLQWALHNENESLPPCTSYICNADIMQHTNKGIIGVRLDLIEDVRINNLEITHLHNQSPLGSYACQDYSGENDGGSQGQLEKGSTKTLVTGLSIFGGDAIFEGYNKIDSISSDYGSVNGLHLMQNAIISMDEASNIDIVSENIQSGVQITKTIMKQLVHDNKYPFPNNFERCNMIIEDTVNLDPNPPNGVASVFCEESWGDS